MNKSISLKQTTKTHFDQTAENYNESHDGKFVMPMYDEIISRVLQLNPSKILDLGCGNGNILKLLNDKINSQLFGLDLSSEMIKEAKKNLSADVRLTIGDAENIPYDDNTFDVIICNASFHHYTKPDIVLKEIKRVLKNNGTFILGDPTAPFEWYLKILNHFLKYTDSGDYRIYGEKEISNLLSSYEFEVNNFKKINYKSFALNAVNKK